MLHSNVVRHHHIPARPITKQSYDRRIRPPQHAHDSPFRPLPASRSAARLTDALQPRHHSVSVHRVFHSVSRNKHVSIELRHRHIRHHKSVSVVMQHQPSPHFISRCRRTNRLTPNVPRGTLCRAPRLRHTPPCRSSLFRPLPARASSHASRLLPHFSARQLVSSPRQLLNRPPLPQRNQHLKQSFALRLSQV